jgi:hypothetical protein
MKRSRASVGAKVRSGFSTYKPAPSQIVSGQYYDSRQFSFAGEDDYHPTPAAMKRLNAAVEAYRKHLQSLHPGTYRVTKGPHTALVDMSEWPQYEMFPDSVEAVLRKHKVWAWD